VGGQALPGMRDKVALHVGESKNPPSGELHSQRRQAGGARHESSDRVVIRAGALETSGWTLNVSRGGIRAVVEDALDPNAEYEVAVGDALPRRARIAWSRVEADGQIVGLRFLDVDGSIPPEEP
jgi:hypothetical protein